MLFENLTSLIDGELLNEPSIASFTNIVFESKKVKRGDLYFGPVKGIDEALKNGAYGIVSTTSNIKDDEIAWIKIKNIKVAYLKLLRYLILKDDSYVLYLDCIKSEILKNITNAKEIFFIDSDIQEAIKSLNSDKKYDLIVFEDKKVFDDLEIVSLEVEIINAIKIQKATNFLMTFIYKESLYKDIKLPALFAKDLEFVLNLCDLLSFEYFVDKLTFLSHFKPVFLDSYFRVLPFGSSRKVIILENKKELLKREIEFIKSNSPWAKIALLLPKNIKYNEKIDIDIKYFKNFADIKKENIFYYNFVIMLDTESKFENYLQKYDNENKNKLF